MPPLAHYKLNGDANDASGNGLHGTPIDVSYVAGKVRQAASLNGTSSYLSIPAAALQTGTHPHSISFWWKTPVAFASREQLLFGYDTNINYSRLWVRVANSGTYYDVYYYASVLLPATISLSTNTYYHFGITAGPDGLILYLDGEVIASSETEPNYQGNQPLTLGADLDSGDIDYGFCGGCFDDVRVYDETLPPWKIRAIYNFGKGSEECQPWQQLIRPTDRRTLHSLIGAA